MAPEHPSVRTPVGSTDVEILKVTKKVYWGQYVTPPSVLPPMAAGRMHKGAMPGTGLMDGQSWPPKQTWIC